jgi:hypothetical protein
MGFGDQRENLLQRTGNRHVDMRCRLALLSRRFAAQRIWVFVQFPKQSPGHTVGEERPMVPGGELIGGCGAGKYFGANYGEFSAVFADQGMEEILGFSLR